MRTALLLAVLALPAAADEVADLVKQLGDDSYQKREEAEKRLVEIGEAAMPALKAAAASEDAEVRVKAGRALSLIEWRKALPKSVLAEFPDAPEQILASDDESRMRWVQALGKSAPGEEAVPAALRFLADGSPRVRKDALLLVSRRSSSLSALRDPASLQRLVPYLRDADPGLRVLAISIAGEWGRPAKSADALATVVEKEVLPEIVASLDDKDGTVRAAAARALGKIRSRAVVGRLCSVAADPVSAVRIAAIEALGLIGDAGGAAAAVKAFGDEGLDVVRAAIDACAGMKAIEAAPAIRAAMAAEGRPSILKQAALEALVAIDPPATADARRCLEDPNAALRAVAWRIVLATAPAEGVKAAADEEAEVRLVAATALARAPRDVAVPALLPLLDDDRAATLRDARGQDLLRGEVRAAAVSSLEAVTGRKSVAAGTEAQAEEWKKWAAAGNK